VCSSGCSHAPPLLPLLLLLLLLLLLQQWPQLFIAWRSLAWAASQPARKERQPSLYLPAHAAQVLLDPIPAELQQRLERRAARGARRALHAA
jgi:hypothetical protein